MNEATMDVVAVLEEVEARAGRLEAMLVDLIRIDTSVPPGRNYPEIVDYLEPLLEAAGLECERVVVPEKRWRRIPLPLEGERVNLVGRAPGGGRGNPPLSIYAHLDVVPAGGGWTVEPFRGTVREGEIIGRGAVDMKGTIPPVVVALELIRELGLRTRYDARILFTTDEEVGVEPGARFLSENGYFEPPVLHLEGGAQDPVMTAAFAGSLDATIKVTGRQVHTGLDWSGVNALEESVPILEELLSLKKEVERRESSYPSFPVPGMPSDRMTANMSVNIMRAGEKINMVPAESVIQVDRRWLPEERLEDVRREIAVAVERGRLRGRALGVNVRFETVYPTHSIDTTSPHVDRWMDCVRKVLGLPDGRPFVFPGSTGSTDMSYVEQALGTRDFIGTAVHRATHTGAHQADESVRTVDMVHLCQELLCFLVADSPIKAAGGRARRNATNDLAL